MNQLLTTLPMPVALALGVLCLAVLLLLVMAARKNRMLAAALLERAGLLQQTEFYKAEAVRQEEGAAVLREEMKAERTRLEARNDDLMRQLQAAREGAARLGAEKTALEEKLHGNAEAMEKMGVQFENLANRIFEEKTSKFRKDSEEGLGQLLMPLRERIQEFQKKVDESFGQQAKEQFSLKKEIERIVLANEKITLQAENLTNALKGESKTQGNWGEVMLEKILEDSGLRKDVDYVVQGSGLDLRNEEGGRMRPDVIVMLPESKHIIVDSKVSLTHYEQYFAAADDAARGVLIKQFLASMRAHITGLEQRGYQNTDQLGTPDFVLMFVPVEGAFALALQHDSTLHSFAWGKRIVMVCPSTLFATLRTIASIWRVERQNRNAAEIAHKSGALYDKIVGFVEDMQLLGKRMASTQEAYEKAWNKLSAGSGNILKRTQDIKALGAKTAKQLPEFLVAEDALPEHEQNSVQPSGETPLVA